MTCLPNPEQANECAQLDIREFYELILEVKIYGFLEHSYTQKCVWLYLVGKFHEMTQFGILTIFICLRS